MCELAPTVPTIAFDTMNYGASFRTDRDPSIPYIATTLLEAIDSLGVEKFHTLGHHTGASIQIEMANQAPERLLSLILNGVMFTTIEEGSELERKLVSPNPIHVKGTQFMWAWSRAKDSYGFDPFAFRPGGRTDGDAELAAPIMHRETMNTLTAGEDWEWAYKAVFRYDLQAALRNVRNPMFFICGQYDPSVVYHEAAIAAYPEVPKYTHPGSGIFFAETHTAEYADYVRRFLKSLAA